MVKDRVFTASRRVFGRYEELGPGDCIVGRLPLRQGEEHLLLDLVTRGVRLIPSACSQLCARSKVYQARLLGHFMIPGTLAIYSGHEMMDAVNLYGKMGVGKVVVKLDRANGGKGVLQYDSIEAVYSQQALGLFQEPFVVQPYMADCSDVRVVWFGKTVEAYSRVNPYNFRQNLSCGAKRVPWDLSEEQGRFCQQVMDRSGSPYGLLDLMVRTDGLTWLCEINLRGGLQGAGIDQQQYLDLVERTHAELLEAALVPEQDTGPGQSI